MSSFDPKLVEQLSLALKEFSPDDPNSPDLIWMSEHVKHRIGPDLAPVPHLLLFLLVNVLQYPEGHRGDKTHWALPFKYHGIRCCLADEKFGLRLYIEKSVDPLRPEQVLGKLHKALRTLEKRYLAPFAAQQLSANNVTVANLFRSLDEMYHFFRQRAHAAFENRDTPSNDEVTTLIAGWLNISLEASTEGFYYTLAMMDAYFSRLEHMLVFCLPFSTSIPEESSLLEFIALPWGQKFKRVFDVVRDSRAKEFYDALDEIKESYRNTFAHGGFEKRGASLYFHLPEAGAIPVRLSGVKESPHFQFVLGKPSSFQELCRLFDSHDSWLATDSMRYALRYLESGLSLSFDVRSIREIRSVIRSDEAFEEWFEHANYRHDIYVNADY